MPSSELLSLRKSPVSRSSVGTRLSQSIFSRPLSLPGREIETEAGLRRPPSVFPKAGDWILILYDPANPDRNAPAEALNVVFA